MRSAEKARFHKSALKRQGIRVIAIKQETSDDASGHLAEGMFELFDQYESEINGMRTAAGLREAARQGFFPSPHPPFGFCRRRFAWAAIFIGTSWFLASKRSAGTTNTSVRMFTSVASSQEPKT